MFVAAVADLCGVDASLVSVEISQARRRRLDDAGVVVTYTIEVETAENAEAVSTLIEDSSAEDVSAAVKTAAAEAGVDDEFAAIETTAVGTPTTSVF